MLKLAVGPCVCVSYLVLTGTDHVLLIRRKLLFIIIHQYCSHFNTFPVERK